MRVMNRREFIAANAIVAASVFVHTARGQEEGPSALRTITYNVLGCRGFPENQSNRERLQAARAQIPERIALELAIYRPDIVTFQEGPSEDVVARIADNLNMRFVFFPGGWPGDGNYPGGFPGAILTRYPILSSQNCPMADGGRRPGDLFTRHWGAAVLDTPFGRLPVFSGHLHPSDAAVREREVTEALRVMTRALARDGSLLFQGDLNHRSAGPEYPRWKDAGFTDAFAAKGTDGQEFTFSSPRPRGRIDYIWVAGAIAKRLQSCRILWEGAFRTNPDDPASFALSDHVPVYAEFGS